MQLVLDSSGLHLSKHNNTFLLKSENGKRSISPAKISSIAITSNVTVTTSAISLAVKHQIPILLFDRIGKARARLWSPYFESIATLRRLQVRFGDSPEATSWMLDLFSLKTMGQLENIKYLRSKKGSLNLALNKAGNSIKRNQHGFDPFRDKLLDECRQQIMGVEGNIARIYWQAVGNSLPTRYRFQTRSRRPAADHFNASINYLYGMLYSVVEGGLFSVGLDPHLGFLHADEHRKPTLTFDLIEPFRPWLDRLLVEQCFEKKIQDSFFTKNQYGLFLNKSGKAFIIPLFNDFMRTKRNYLQQETTVKNHIYFMAGRLAQRIRAFE